jgi:hypothetical protein
MHRNGTCRIVKAANSEVFSRPQSERTLRLSAVRGATITAVAADTDEVASVLEVRESPNAKPWAIA